MYLLIRRTGVNPEKCFSFFKVGGGFTAQDYASVWQATEGKWKTWNKKHPPTEYITLGGKDKQFERPDVWIKPSESVVLEVKAASVGPSESFGTSYTLRFPRFKKLRSDKKWDDALSVDEFLLLKARVDEESKNKEFKVDTKRHITKKLKKELSIAGNDTKVKTPYAGPKTELFEGLNFCVLTEMLHPVKKPKAELEQIIKSNGGKIFQSPTAKEDIICIGDKKLVKVASLMKSGHTCVVRGAWILDVLKQAEIDGPGRSRFLIPFEPGHMFYMTEEARMGIEGNVDPYGDSYARDVSPADLKHIFEEMIPLKNYNFSPKGFLDELEEHGKGLGEMRASMFRDRVVRFWPDGGQTMVDEQLKLDLQIIRDKFMFAGGAVAESDEEEGITHFAIVNESADTVKALREQVVVTARRLPRIVGLKWLQDSWSEGTLLDEEIYAVVA
jgi:DNA ligase-4